MVTARPDATLIDEVAAIVRRAANIPQRVPIRAESSLCDDLRLDSLDIVAVVIQLQDHFEVVIDEDAVPNLGRVVDLASHVAERRESLRS
jgi:acyl carrier protein